MRPLRRRGGLIGALVVLTAALASCARGDDFESFARSYATTVCQRAAECCTSADFTALFGASQAECDQKLLASLDNGRGLLSYGIMRYDPVAGAACLTEVRTESCALFSGSATRLCSNVLVGTTPLGGVCDGDYFCASGDCEGQRCVVRPAPPCDLCPPDEYCDLAAQGCRALVGGGGACTSSEMCGDSAACLGGVCAPLLQEGETCSIGRDCATGTCSSSITHTFPGICRPPICAGA